MTLCIAAICRADKGKGKKEAIISCDRRVTVGFMTGDFEYKLRRLGHSWIALLAGDLPLSRELASRMETWLVAKSKEIDKHNVIEHLRTPIDCLRRTLMDRHVQKRLGMNATEFFKVGKSLPEGTFAEITQELTKLEFDAEMLLIGRFWRDTPI